MSPPDKISPSRRRVLKAAGTLAAGLAAPAVLRIRPAFAAYPERAVRIIVANTPGGPSDIIARIMAAAMQQATPGSSFFVENRGGAGGNLGMGAAARAEPDGYTILLTTSAYAVNPGLYNKLPYDPFKDFVGIVELATSPHVFAIKPDLGPKTMKEFVALAKPIRRSSTSRRRRSALRRCCRPRCSSKSKVCRAWRRWSTPGAATRSRR
jgi:tripartite-type tricarboxylate transporter receptor subunit TctC